MIDVSYFPGCSMKTSAKENNESLQLFCRKIGINLIELKDWSCCGSSSAHSINNKMAFDLASRNLSIAPAGRPLLVACPSCTLRLKECKLHLDEDETARERFNGNWKTAYNPNLEIIHFFELLEGIDLTRFLDTNVAPLKGLKFAPYYGCMLARPPKMRREKNYHGLMEKILESLGATAVPWASGSKCCGTFLSVAKPDAITTVVNDINSSGSDAGADCLVTACSMCQLNLEIRCNLKQPIPTLHFSEILSLALGVGSYKRWFPRHIVDPAPLLKRQGLIA